MSTSTLRAPWAVGLANTFNLQTLPRHADQILIAAAVYQALYAVASPVVTRKLIPQAYDKFDRRSQISWHIRSVSFVQAIFICTRALAVIFNDPSRRTATAQQRLWDYSPQAGAVQAYAAGYFLWDTYISALHLNVTGPGALVHAICAFVVTMIGFRPFGNYYGVNFVLYELSTPFLNIHWTLDKLGKTGSNLQLYNGLALMASFFGCRLAWGSYQTCLMTSDMISAWRAGPVPRILFPAYLLANTTLTCLNFYWFSRMIQALRKRFEPKENQE